ncbi:MAG: DHH family phosphoesterase [Patescibacteria group bacterium]|nr:DHH family phosphoesterase [Patescibacteria group bacterium]
MESVDYIFGRTHEAIKRADRVLLVAHKRPDGDTLGASSSVFRWLKREDKDVTLFCQDLPSKQHRYLEHHGDYTDDPSVFEKNYDLVIIFDSGDLRYAGIHEHMNRLSAGFRIINIDHHITNERYGHLNIVLPQATSTSEIMYRFFEANGINIDAAMATALLTGVFFDTSNLTNTATTPESIAVCSKLMDAGARYQEIIRHTIHDKSIDLLQVWGTFLSRLRFNGTYGVVSTYVLNSDFVGVPAEAVDGAANFLNAVVGDGDTVLILKETPNGMIKGSFRSIGRDVSKVAKLMGGGGHKKAAGFVVTGRIEVTPEGPVIIRA